MAMIRQYFETDFDYAVRVRVRVAGLPSTCEAAMLYDPNAKTAFLALYLPEATHTSDDFLRILSAFQYGKSRFDFAGAVVLPSTRQFHGAVRVENINPLRIEYKLYGDPHFRSLFDTAATTRVFLYSEVDLSDEQVSDLQKNARRIGHDLQFRGKTYARERHKREKPEAFISHDARDKEIARTIAARLQTMLCSVWYDEYSLDLGDNLRTSIEKGLKECKKCVLILSSNFMSNTGWGKKEFDSIFTREVIEGANIMLPIWHGVTKQMVYDYSPSLLNVKGANWSELGEDEVCRQIFRAISKSSLDQAT